jgi:hypothetical protein
VAIENSNSLGKIASVATKKGHRLSDLAKFLQEMLPVERMGQVMSKIEFRCRFRYQLLIPMFNAGTPCPRCGLCMDQWGDHAVQCRMGRGMANTYRHNAVRDILIPVGKEVGTVLSVNLPYRFGCLGSRPVGLT